MSTLRAGPDLYDYLDATQFLNDLFSFRKSNASGFSYSSWAREIGLSNKTVLRFILKKERRISPRSSQLFIKNLNLSTDQMAYFETLVSYSQAKSKQEKRSFGTTLMQLQRSRYRPLETTPTQQLQNAVSPVVLSLLAFKDVTGTRSELSRLLNLDVTIVENSLTELQAQGLIQENTLGHFSFDGPGFKIPDRPGDLKLRHYHEHWIEKAKLAIDLDPKIRKFRALKFALNEDEFQVVLDRINDFAISILASFNSSTLDNRRLYMLETLLFPIANITNGPKSLQTAAEPIP